METDTVALASSAPLSGLKTTPEMGSADQFNLTEPSLVSLTVQARPFVLQLVSPGGFRLLTLAIMDGGGGVAKVTVIVVLTLVLA